MTHFGLLPSPNLFSRISFILLIFLVLFPASVFPVSKFVLFASVLALGAISLVARKEVWPLDTSGLELLCGVFLLFVSFSLLTTVSLERSLSGIVVWMFYLVVFAQGKETGRTWSGKILLLILFIGLIHAIYSIFQRYWVLPALELDLKSQGSALEGAYLPRIASYRVFSTFSLPSHLALFLAMVFPLTVWLFLDSKGGFRKILIVLGAACLVFALVLTQSYAGWAALGGAFLLYFFFVKRIRWFYYFGIVALVLLLFYSVYLLRGTSPFDSGIFGSSFSGRLGNASSAFRMIAESPVAGCGYGCFGLVYPEYMREGDNETQYAHNSYLQFAAELGVWGGLLLLAIAMMYNWSYIRRRRRTGRTGFTERDAFFIATNAFWLHNFVDFSIYAPELGSFGFLAAALSLPEDKNGAYLPTRSFLRGAARIGVALLLLLCLLHTCASYRSTQFYEAAKELARKSNDEAYPVVVEACRWNPLSERGKELAFFILDAQKTHPEDRIILLELEETEPRLPWVHYVLGTRMAASGDWSEAYYQLKRAGELFPLKYGESSTVFGEAILKGLKSHSASSENPGESVVP